MSSNARLRDRGEPSTRIPAGHINNAKCHDIICAENTVRPRLACEQPLRHGKSRFICDRHTIVKRTGDRRDGYIKVLRQIAQRDARL